MESRFLLSFFILNGRERDRKFYRSRLRFKMTTAYLKFSNDY
ncbi:hypothetical protein LEP1GSC047_1729 [Leptospira inadai serovar Lyme str. 10]|uniref:Uncharacterized protein n=1 Tax=Leptospira inadai serovar Lyme str. 10 TaxID=1049790 RepID=V6H8T1_9LEPT|nr:hypothetical protein LEP1GSC047_1729 [Leptospira inadai serovar Lyme str. 10]